MKTRLRIGEQFYEADLNRPIDISIPLFPDHAMPNAYWAPAFRTEPVRAGDFIGDTQQGGVVNFKNVFLNPHGNGTHTECVGHIIREPLSIHHCLRHYHFPARLVSVLPRRMEDGDLVVHKDDFLEGLEGVLPTALIIRTLPNHSEKAQKIWSGTNPPYLSAGLTAYLRLAGVRHLLTDLPSVDRESDGGALAAHKAFWGCPDDITTGATITEMVYVPDHVSDGFYFLNLQIASFVLDVSPSKPVIYDCIPL